MTGLEGAVIVESIMLSVSNRSSIARARQGHGMSCAWSYAQDPETTTFGITRKPEVE